MFSEITIKTSFQSESSNKYVPSINMCIVTHNTVSPKIAI